MKAVILAAGQGTRLRPLTDIVPKCMVPIAGTTMIDRQIDRIAAAGIDELIVVTGYLHDVLAAHLTASERPLAKNATVVFNERFEDWGNFYSLLVAESAIGADSFIKFDGDVLLDGEVLPALLAAPGPLVLAVDCYDGLGAEEMKIRVDDAGRVVELNKRMEPGVALGESIGIERVDAAISAAVFNKLRALVELGETDEYYERAYELLIADGCELRYADISACTWSEVDDAADLKHAESLVAGGE